MKLPPFVWFIVGLLSAAVIVRIGPPELVVPVCALVIVVCLLLLAMAAFHIAERSDGRG